MIELDTKLTADDHVVVIHDRTVDRTTNAKGEVRKFTLNEIQKLDAGIYFSQKYSGEKIPSLEEVLSTYSGKILINIELTNYTSPFDALPDKVASLIYQLKCSDQILVSSFHPIPLRRFNKQLPGIPVGFLARQGISGSLSRSWVGEKVIPYQAIHLEKSDVSQRFLARAHKSGKRVHSYTANSKEDMQSLFAFGVDGVITDDPRMARLVLEGGNST